MAVDIMKADSGWIIKSSDAGSTGGLTRGSSAGVAMPGVKDVMEFLMAVDSASNGRRYYFTRSDGAPVKAYPSERKTGSIVIERAAGNWVRLSPGDAADLRMKLTRM
jgi:hypothetical protein